MEVLNVPVTSFVLDLYHKDRAEFLNSVTLHPLTTLKHLKSGLWNVTSAVVTVWRLKFSGYLHDSHKSFGLYAMLF